MRRRAGGRPGPGRSACVGMAERARRRSSPTRAAVHDREASYPFEDFGARGAPATSRRRSRRSTAASASTTVARPGRRIESPRPRRRVGRDRREHAPRRGAEHRAPLADRGRRGQRAPCRGVRRLAGERRKGRHGDGRGDQRALPGHHEARDGRGPHRGGLADQRPQDLLHDVARGKRPLHGRHVPRRGRRRALRLRPDPDRRAGCRVHDDWDAMGMRASGSNSVTLDGVELPAAALRGGFPAGDPVPYMERNLAVGLFHASASLGIAESADEARRAVAKRGRPPTAAHDAGRRERDRARRRARRSVPRGDADRRALRRQPGVRRHARSSSTRSSPRPRRPRRSSTRPERASSTARSRCPAAPATSTAACSRGPTATSRRGVHASARSQPRLRPPGRRRARRGDVTALSGGQRCSRKKPTTSSVRSET